MSSPRQDDPAAAHGADSSGPVGRALTPDHRVVSVHRVAAVVVALVIGVFGVLGFVGGLGFFDTEGQDVAGLSTNGLLSTISLVTAVVLVAAAARGGRLASTVMMVIGVLFLVSAFVNLGLLGTSANILAFRLPNVFFSIGAGMVLLFLGAYGRASGGLPANNPYKMERPSGQGQPGSEGAGGTGSGRSSGDDAESDQDQQPRPGSNEEHRADQEMADAARAVAEGVATDEQRRRLDAISQYRAHEERRRAWMDGASA